MISISRVNQSAYRDVWPIFGVFFCESVVLGSWVPRIPDIKDAFALSDAALGMCLLVIPLGTIVAFLTSTRLLHRSGMRNGCRVWLPIWSLVFILPALVSGQPALMIVLILAGFAVGMCEVSMNTKADMIEANVGFRIMSRCHGFWSLGSMFGALVGSVLAQWGWSLLAHLGTVLPLVAIAGYLCATALPEDVGGEVEHQQQVKRPLLQLPSRAILLLCLMPVGIMLVEGTFIDWSALFMREVLYASPIVIGITYAFFSVVMASTRLMGDTIADRYGDKRVVQCSGIAAFTGLLIFAAAPDVLIAMLGAAIAGAGVAIVYPVAMSAVARRPGNVADNVAALSLVSFVAFLLAPPCIGFISDQIGLRWALFLLLPLVASTPFLASEVER